MSVYNISDFSNVMVIESWDMIVIIGGSDELDKINKDDIVHYSPGWSDNTITWKCKIVSKKKTDTNVILYAITENLGELIAEEDVDGWG